MLLLSWVQPSAVWIGFHYTVSNEDVYICVLLCFFFLSFFFLIVQSVIAAAATSSSLIIWSLVQMWAPYEAAVVREAGPVQL